MEGRVRARMEGQNKPRHLTDWLEKNYPNKKTREYHKTSLKNWVKCFYGKDSVTNYMGINVNIDRKVVNRNIEERVNEIEEGLERYLSELEDRDFTDDFKKFLNWARNEGYANSYISSMSASVKTFFSEQSTRCKISDEDWANIKRTLMPKSRRAATQDDILTKEQLRMVLQHASVHGKALALFLLSTGVRIGAACQLKMRDIILDKDPPEVSIREEYTKGQVGGRVMWFSEEARDAIIEWHKVRPFKKKPGLGHGSYDEKKVFNVTANSFTKVWNRALKRADGGAVPPVLAKRDPSTKRRIHVYHVHTLRKFFRTNMGVEGTYQGKSGIPDMIVHGWMGHKAYLAGSYDKLGRVRMAEIYKDNMDVVTVYEVGVGEKASAKYREMVEKAERAEKLEKKTRQDEEFIKIVGGQLGAFIGLTEEERDVLSDDEKKNLIIHKVSQLKADADRAREQSLEEIEKYLKYKLTTK